MLTVLNMDENRGYYNQVIPIKDWQYKGEHPQA